MLSQRQETVLKIIVNEYIATGVPVASEVVAYNYRLGVSPATIRNDMASLAREGYIQRPHTSAGAMPSPRAYRHYVESLAEPVELTPAEQRLVSHLFHQVEGELEEWLRLSASLLARLTEYAALVTRPKAVESHYRHLHLVSLHQFLALLVLVLREARLGQQMLPLEETISQEELDAAANRLNHLYFGLTAAEITTLSAPLLPVEEQITRSVVSMMLRRDEQALEEPYFYGWEHILSQPEFLYSREAKEMMAVLEGKRLSAALLPHGGGIKVIIGDENEEQALRQFSLVVAEYGIPQSFTGLIGVVGPTRMRYGRAISAVQYVSSRLSQLVSEIAS